MKTETAQALQPGDKVQVKSTKNSFGKYVPMIEVGSILEFKEAREEYKAWGDGCRVAVIIKESVTLWHPKDLRRVK